MTVVAFCLALVSVMCWPAPSPWLPPPDWLEHRAQAVTGPRPHRAASEPAQDGGPRMTRQAVADAVLLLALALRSGAGVVDSLEAVVEVSDGLVAHELDMVATALRWDRPPAQAWAFAHDVWAPVATALGVSADTGAAPADAVAAAAASMRGEAARAREAGASRAAVLLVLPLGLLFLPAFVCTAVVPVVIALAAGSIAGP